MKPGYSNKLTDETRFSTGPGIMLTVPKYNILTGQIHCTPYLTTIQLLTVGILVYYHIN